MKCQALFIEKPTSQNSIVKTCSNTAKDSYKFGILKNFKNLCNHCYDDYLSRNLCVFTENSGQELSILCNRNGSFKLTIPHPKNLSDAIQNSSVYLQNLPENTTDEEYEKLSENLVSNHMNFEIQDAKIILQKNNSKEAKVVLEIIENLKTS